MKLRERSLLGSSVNCVKLAPTWSRRRIMLVVPRVIGGVCIDFVSPLRLCNLAKNLGNIDDWIILNRVLYSNLLTWEWIFFGRRCRQDWDNKIFHVNEKLERGRVCFFQEEKFSLNFSPPSSSFVSIYRWYSGNQRCQR